MSRSYRHLPLSLPRGLGRSLEEAFDWPQPTRRWAGANTILHTVYRDDWDGVAPERVPHTAIATELERRGWPRKVAERWLLNYYSGWACHDRKDDRVYYQRSYRHGTNQHVRMGHEDVQPWRTTHGWLTW